MLGRRVACPDGSAWWVGRRLSPWRPHFIESTWDVFLRLGRSSFHNEADFAWVHGEALKGGAMAMWMPIMGIAALLEGALILAVSVVYVPWHFISRALLLAPWRIEARRVGSRRRHDWEVFGWVASRTVMAEVVDDLVHQRSPRPQYADREGLIEQEWTEDV
jgi:hypothetical protein